jgi:hypothetical protein
LRPPWARWRGLVAARRQHDTIERIAEQHLDQAQIGEVAVERGGRALAGLLDGMSRELKRHAARIPNALAHALGKLEVVPVARRQIAAALGDADDRPARLQLAAREAEVQIALEVERGHARIMRIVEPGLRAQPALRIALCVSRWFLHGLASRAPDRLISPRPWPLQSPPELVPSMISRVGSNLAGAGLTASHQKGGVAHPRGLM